MAAADGFGTAALYACRYTAYHLAEGKAWEELLELLCETDYLARQARVFEGFGPGATDVEELGLPAAIKSQDGARFAQLASVALQLRGLARALADERIFEHLAAQGGLALVLGLLPQIAGRRQRVHLRAAVIRALARREKDQPEHQSQLAQLREELSQLTAAGEAEGLDEPTLLAAHRPCAAVEVPMAEPGPMYPAAFEQLADNLRRARYLVPHDDLVRFLDAAAALRPDRLRGLLANVLVSPAGCPQLLETLARETRQDQLIQELACGIHRYAQAVSRTLVEAWPLRFETLCTLLTRRCQLQNSIAPLDDPQVLSNLLAEECVPMRQRVAAALIDIGAPDLGAQAAQTLSQDTFARARLHLLAGAAEAGLNPADLYLAARTDHTLEDEAMLLGVQVSRPWSDEGFARARKLPESTQRVRAHCLYVHHVLSFQARELPRRYWTIRKLLGDLFANLKWLGGNDALVELIPQLVALSPWTGPQRTLRELREAVARLLVLDEVPWLRRRTLLGDLLQQAPQRLAQACRLYGSSATRCQRRGRQLVAWLGKLERNVLLNPTQAAQWTQLAGDVAALTAVDFRQAWTIEHDTFEQVSKNTGHLTPPWDRIHDFVNDLRQGNERRARQALIAWMQDWVAPQPGHFDASAEARQQALIRALERAQRLDPTAASTVLQE